MDDTFVGLQAALADRYRLEHLLGRGGMGAVYLAHDLKHGRAVAIKVLRPEVAVLLGRERFLREIGIAAQLSHPHIVPLHDSGEADGQLYYVMPYIAGETLRERLERDGPLPVDAAVRIAQQVATALVHAHGHGVVHRDIKPSNILLSEGFALVADFGLARALSRASEGADISSIGLPIGTPLYMSPEQAVGAPDVDGRSDLFSLGCVLYEMLAGSTPGSAGLPSGGEPQALVSALRPEVPAAVGQAVTRCLARNPAERFATAEEFLAALGEVTPAPFGSVESPAPVSGGTPVVSAGPGRRRLWVSGVVLGVIGGAALLARIGWSLLAPGPTRIAVLLYDNRGAAEDEAFADGLAEEITDRLAGIPSLRIIGRQSVLKYKNAPKTPAEIGKELGVDYVLGGTLSFDRSVSGPARMRIHSSLQRATDNTVVWTRNDSGALVVGEVFAAQVKIADNVLVSLNVSLSEPERTARRKVPTSNLAAYHEYLLGRSQFTLFTEARIKAAIGHFELAVSLDSTFAPAYAGLSNAWMAHPNFWNRLDSTKNLVPSAAEAYRQAERAARHALALDSTLIEAQFQLANLRQRSTLDFESSTAEMYALAARDPDFPDPHRALRAALTAQGRPEEALVQSRKTVELDPLSPLANTFLAVDLSATGRRTEAMKVLRTAIEMSPSFGQAYMILGTLLLQSGQRLAGADSVRRFLELRDYPLAGDSVVAAALAGRGSVPAALEVLDGFARAEWEPEPRLAGLYALLGDKERALNVLERARARRMWDLFLQRHQPFLSTLRDEPRFKALWVVAPRP